MFKGMVKGMKEFAPLFQGFIAFSALIGLFSFSVNIIVDPIKQDISKLESGQVRLEDKLDKLLAKDNEFVGMPASKRPASRLMSVPYSEEPNNRTPKGEERRLSGYPQEFERDISDSKK